MNQIGILDRKITNEINNNRNEPPNMDDFHDSYGVNDSLNETFDGFAEEVWFDRPPPQDSISISMFIFKAAK